MKEVGNPSRLRGKDVTYISDKQFDASSRMYFCFSGSWLATDKKKMRGIQFQILSHMQEQKNVKYVGDANFFLNDFNEFFA